MAGMDWMSLLQSLGNALSPQSGGTNPSVAPTGNVNPLQSQGMGQYGALLPAAAQLASTLMNNNPNARYSSPQAAQAASHAAMMHQLMQMPGMLSQLNGAMQGIQNTGLQRQNNAIGLAQGLPGMPTMPAGVMGAPPVSPQFQNPMGQPLTGPSMVPNPFMQQQAPFQPGMQGMLSPHL